MWQAGATRGCEPVRVRSRGRKRIQTLELPAGDGAGGAFGRGECEWPITSEGPELDRPVGTPAVALLGPDPSMREVFRTEVDGAVRTLRRDGAVVDVALDLGTVRAGKVAEEIRELEPEQGSAAALYRLAVELQAGLPLILGAEKADRAW